MWGGVFRAQGEEFDQHPILTDRDDVIIGNYFEKVK